MYRDGVALCVNDPLFSFLSLVIVLWAQKIHVTHAQILYPAKCQSLSRYRIIRRIVDGMKNDTCREQELGNTEGQTINDVNGQVYR